MRKTFTFVDVDNKARYCKRLAIANRLSQLRELGGIRCGKLHNVLIEGYGDGYLMTVREDSWRILFDLDVLIRLNTVN